MIHKVNRPPALKLVTAQPKQSENDPGASSGNGMFYSGPDPKPEEDQKQDSKEQSLAKTQTSDSEEKQKNTPHLKIVQSLNEVYEEHFKKKKETPSAGLTTQYSGDASPAKGMLLNKKVE